MKAALLYELGKPFRVEEVPVPRLRDEDVLVKVDATFVAPSMKNIAGPGGNFIRPTFPAILGSDSIGTISEPGKHVKGLKVGQRVWVNSILYEPNDEFALKGREGLSDSMAFQGMFVFNPNNVPLMDEYQGGFSEYIKAPSYNVVPLPDNFPTEHAVRLGYLGTAYHGLKRADVHYGSTVIINGATGSVGTGAVMLALAMGAVKVIAIANKKDRLKQLKQIDPGHIETISLLDGEVTGKIMELTGGKGADSFVDCLSYVNTTSTQQCIYAVKRGGIVVCLGGATGVLTIPYGFLLGTEITLTGSIWFHSHEATEIINLATSGKLNLGLFDVKSYPLDKINEAVEFAGSRVGGMTTTLVKL